MNRRERRLMEKLKKKPNKELMADFKKFYPNVKVVGREREDGQVMTYEEFINNVQITDELKKELELHDENNKKELNFNLI